MSETRIRRSWGIVTVFLVAGLLGLVGAAVSNADDHFGCSRLAGNDRYDTAGQVAIRTFGTSDVVIIASGEAFPDALASGYVAGLGAVPILLTAQGSLPSPTSTALTTLKTTKALLVGGTSAISAAVETKLNDDGIDTSRVAGANRYETAAQLARSGGPGVVGKTGGPLPPAAPTAIVVSGENYADALSAGPAADANHLPVLLTPQAGLAAPTKDFLGDSNYGIKNVIIVGGTAAVSQSVEDEIKAMGITVTRIAGNDRSDTAAKVADFEISKLSFGKSHVNIARGDGFADALAAAPHAGKDKAPLLLTQSATVLSNSTSTWLSTNKADLKDCHIFGGTSAVSNDTQKAAETAAGNSTGSTTTTEATTTTTAPAPSLTPCPAGTSGPGQPFCTTTADKSGAPKLVSAVLNFSRSSSSATSTITAKFSEAVDCSTVSAADFKITITDKDTDNDAISSSPVPPLVAVTAAPSGDDPVQSATCGNPGDTSSPNITLTPNTVITPRQEGTVSTVGVVKDTGGAPAPTSSTGSSVPWTGPKFSTTTLPTYSNQGGSKITVTYDQTVDCGTVDPTPGPGSDYAVIDKGTDGTGNTPINVSTASCSSNKVTITIASAPASGHKIAIVLSSDNAKVANPAGSLQPTDDATQFTMA